MKSRVNFVVAIHLCALVCTACAAGTPSLQESIRTPDGGIVADWYSVSAGGAAGSSIDRVRLRRTTETFVADDQYVFSAISGHTMKVTWIGQRQLEISYDKNFLVRRSTKTWRDVTVQYRVEPR